MYRVEKSQNAKCFRFKNMAIVSVNVDINLIENMPLAIVHGVLESAF